MTHLRGQRRGRLGVALVAVVALLVSGCSSEGASTKDVAKKYKDIPAETGTPQDGGTITVALTPGLTPNYIYPYPPASVSGTVIARGLMWRALYRPSGTGDAVVNAEQSLAELPETSEDRTTVTIRLKDYQWSNGRKVTADDVVFSLELLKAAIAKSPGNWSFYTPGQFPDGVSAEATDEGTVTLSLETAYNESYLLSMLALLYVMPSEEWSIAETGGPRLDFRDPKNAKAIYTYLTQQAEDQAGFTTNPLWQVVNGPFRLKSFDPTTGSFSLVANEEFSGPGEQRLDQVDFKAFTSASAVLNQYKAGTLTVGTLDASFASEIDTLKSDGYHVYGAPAPARIDPLTFNFENTVESFGKIAAQPYVRQALQHLIDQKGYIESRGVYNGTASENYSVAGADTPYPPEFGAEATYPFDPAKAEELLTQHGWKVVPNGTTTCERPGTGEDQCGEGIPQGAKISFTLASANTPSYVGARDVAFASEAKKLGIEVEVVTKSLNYMYSNYGNSFAPAKKNEWGMQDYGAIYLAAGYPSSNTVFNTTGTFNLGSYSNEEVDALIDESTFGADPSVLAKETTAVSEDLPVLFFPTPHTLVVWKDTLSGPPESFHSLLSFLYSPELWYLTK
ncbi:ABC transporter substrate-binding protein [Nocardioides sp. R1-1]|uniref:ABC transporter substrate-binding protein n=1 Tax=Nocardioides sp. R1-1 TaxID=3383502 RepID=UPI0038D0AFFC